MSVTGTYFGSLSDGQPIRLYTLKVGDAMVKVINYGARVTELHVPDKSGKVGNVVLGFDNLAQYVGDNPYFGCVAGRVANRIAGGAFELDGDKYTLNTNNGPNTLHGGAIGFDRRVWAASSSDEPGLATLTLSYRSPDGEEGFPGNLTATVTYILNSQRQFQVDFLATSDKATPVNLCHHGYFNLAGSGNGNILGHDLTVNADRYTPVNNTLIPTGEVRPVKGTPLDFTHATKVGARIAEVLGGYDHNFALNTAGDLSKVAAKLHDPSSGRTLKVYTSKPGLQVYTGNFLDGSLAGIGGKYFKHGGICLEAQHFPDSVHHSHFPSTILRPGQVYRHTTVYAFSAND